MEEVLVSDSGEVVFKKEAQIKEDSVEEKELRMRRRRRD